MIKRLYVEKLRGVAAPHLELNFRQGLNLLTGKNGSGKTTLIKLIWYLISGNLHRATDETRFSNLVLETDQYTLKVSNSGNLADRIEIITKDREYVFEQNSDDEDMDWDNDIEGNANSILVDLQKTLYFPTFRRIEGGYGISATRARPSRQSDIEGAFESLSRSLSNQGHRFVSYVSTTDISRLLLEKYTEISGQINKVQSDVSGRIILQIKEYQVDDESDEMGTRAKEILDQVKQSIEKLDDSRRLALQPMAAIENTVREIFKGKPIKIGANLNFGDAAQAISSEHLSAGEKQMLSFICYNALFNNTVIFIDEPELSLHPDWQRILFRVLYDQNPTNQFIICTHSPFIYSKFPEREIRISGELGDELD